MPRGSRSSDRRASRDSATGDYRGSNGAAGYGDATGASGYPGGGNGSGNGNGSSGYRNGATYGSGPALDDSAAWFRPAGGYDSTGVGTSSRRSARPGYYTPEDRSEERRVGKEC